uniref:Uncharacterized protein n=1 Tax=Plectus sambesii TaxID=2011161 RepID=A0A914V696_9BILA
MLLQPAVFNPVLAPCVWPTNNVCAEENDDFDPFAVDCHFPIHSQPQPRSASADDVVAKGSNCWAPVPHSLDTPLSKSLENIIMDDLFKSSVSQQTGPVTCAPSQVYGRCPVESATSSETTSRHGSRLSVGVAARARVADRDRDLEQLIDRMLEVQSIPSVGGYASAQPATSSSSASSSAVGGFSLNSTPANSAVASPPSPSPTVANSQLLDYKTPSMQHLGLHNVKSEPLSGMPMPLSIGASPTTISDIFSSMGASAAAGAHGYASPMQLFAGGFDLQRPPTFAAQPDMMRAYSNPDTAPQFMPPPGASSTQYLSHAHSIPAHLDPPHGIYQQVPPHHLGHIGIPRRGSHGATSSSSTSSHTGTPSPLQNQPLSPTFGIQNMRFSTFADSTVAYSQTPTPTGAQPLGLGDQQDLDADKLCAVCSDRAVCQHYGARTCEGCKGFFKRTVQKKAQYVCAGSKNCPIDKRYRSRCQYCRYQKCLAVGMVKEVVRYGSLQGRRGRLPSKTKCQQSDEPPSPPVPLVTSLARAYTETRPASEVTVNYLSSISGQQLVAMLDTAYVVLMRFVAKIPGTQEMPAVDLRTLLNRNYFPLLALRLAFRSIDSEDELTFENGETIDVQTVPDCWRRLLTAIRIEANGFKHVLDWDASTFACLLSLVLLHYPENSLNLSDNASVDRLESTIVNALKDHCCAPTQPQPSGLAKVMAQIAKFQQFQQLGVETLADYAQSGVQLTDNLQSIMHMMQL